MPGSALRRFRLVTLGANGVFAGPLGTCPLQLDERVAGVLLGLPWPDERVGEVAQLVANVPSSTEHDLLAERIRGWMQTDDASPWPVIQLTGQASDGRVAVALRLCAGLGLRLFRLDLVRFLAVADRTATLQALEREAILSRTALYLEVDEAMTKEAGLAVDDVIDRVRALLILGVRERRPGTRLTLAVELPIPDPADRARLWRQALAGRPHRFDADVERLIDQLDLGPEAIARVVATAEGLARRRSSADPVVTADELREATQRQIRQQLDGLVTRVIQCTPGTTSCCPTSVLDQLREIAPQVAHRATVYEELGIRPSSSDRGRGITALFAGRAARARRWPPRSSPASSGSTSTAIDLAERRQQVHRRDREEPARASSTPPSGAARSCSSTRRTRCSASAREVKDSHDRYANIEVNYLLQRMEDYRGLAILATNLQGASRPRPSCAGCASSSTSRSPTPTSARRSGSGCSRRQAPTRPTSTSPALARLELAGGNIRDDRAERGVPRRGRRRVRSAWRTCMRAARREYAKLDKLIVRSEFYMAASSGRT